MKPSLQCVAWAFRKVSFNHCEKHARTLEILLLAETILSCMDKLDATAVLNQFSNRIVPRNLHS
jgi:coenzyme F420-reducing hydrogenase alpha subunit